MEGNLRLATLSGFRKSPRRTTEGYACGFFPRLPCLSTHLALRSHHFKLDGVLAVCSLIVFYSDAGFSKAEGEKHVGKKAIAAKSAQATSEDKTFKYFYYQPKKEGYGYTVLKKVPNKPSAFELMVAWDEKDQRLFVQNPVTKKFEAATNDPTEENKKSDIWKFKIGKKDYLWFSYSNMILPVRVNSKEEQLQANVNLMERLSARYSSIGESSSSSSGCTTGA